MDANMWLGHNIIAGQRDGRPYYLNVNTGEESLSPPPLPGSGSTDERSSKRRRPSLQSSSLADSASAVQQHFGGASASGGGGGSSSGSSAGSSSNPFDVNTRAQPMLLHARTAPSASNNWVVGKKEGRNCFFNMITKEWTFTPPPMPLHSATVFAAASAIDMAVSPRGLCDSPSEFLGTMSLSPRSPLRMQAAPRESMSGDGGGLLDGIVVDEAMLLALEESAWRPSLSQSQSAGEDSKAGAASAPTAMVVAALAPPPPPAALSAVPAAVSATVPTATPAVLPTTKGKKKSKGSTEAATLRRVKNREAANRCRQKKASRVQELEVQVAGLDATVSTLRQQLTASTAQNSALKGQLDFLRDLLTTFAKNGSNAGGVQSAALAKSLGRR